MKNKIRTPNKAYSLWGVNGCQQGFRSAASISFGGEESALKPPQAICKALRAIKIIGMNSDQKEQQITETEISRLRIALIILTIVQAVFIILMFTDLDTYFKLIYDNYSKWILASMNFSVAAIILWYNWTRLPIDKKKRIDNTWLILLLGVIGMWLWIPNKEEIEKMNQKLHTTKTINNAN